ncbi:acyltransferase family protein [Agreia pratensis]|uniref:Peptidoglycan/LPS O-acetylase OafA/YrhL, contains acyltransferase and SGNH-hydrolase domains n=1 Tax=Agreia pratensis TaxID=150121 RepID=A0A1X7INY0_9MICO|nr:acyltransferase [Agreia pratensis]SMG16112.1 Peptidoglycan/LPS O-acetylase OafA/YrhL, contains acyltransferase and SGNH-hydrolase domains [Agreia pratensis]
MTTVGEAFDPDRNSLNAIRLLLASAVIVSHSWLVNGLGLPPMVGGTDAGLVAVAGFFGISGYLVTASRLRSSSLPAYLWRRFLRIYPAFLVVLAVTAFVFAPLSTLLDGRSTIDWAGAAAYVLNNAGLFVRQLGVPDTLSNNAYPFVWNLPLWTLFYEAVCYLLIGVLVSVVSERLRGAVVCAMFVVAMSLSLVFLWAPGFLTSPVLESAANLAGFFLAGSLIHLYRDLIPSRAALAIVAALLAAMFAFLGVFSALAALPIAYLLIYLSTVMAPLDRVGRRNDISYGMYIYGFPVQQGLVLLLLLAGWSVPIWLFAALAVVVTVPFAWASWLAVESPALRLKGLVGRQGLGARRLRQAE